ncbi:MAG: hypothetical protein AAF242_13300 [Bacteroidota bacterium]
MNRLIIKWLMVIVLAIGMQTYALAGTNNKGKRPPKPERIEEAIPDQPSSYHTWVSGKWKWNRAAADWQWRAGFWREMSPNEIYRRDFNRFNPYGFNRFGLSPYFYGGALPLRYRLRPRLILIR